MEVMYYIDSLKKGWWIILGVIFLALSLVMAYDYVAPPQYQATARFIVYPNIDANVTGNEMINSLDSLSDRTVLATYSEVIDSIYIRKLVCAELGISLEQYDDIFEQTSVVLPNANIFETSLISYDPELVKDVLDLTGRISVEYINELYDVYLVSYLDSPIVPTNPIRPQPVRDSILAVLFGSILGILIVIGKDQILMPIEEIRQRRNIDPTSKAYRKSYVTSVIEDAIHDYKNTQNTFSIGLIRLNGLKDWVEIIPQGNLDQIISNQSEMITNILKGSDIVGRWDRLTFILFLPRTEEYNANLLLNKLAKALEKPIKLSYANEIIQTDPSTSVIQYNENTTYNDMITVLESKLE
jgi:capsular polysaccharide biosynthesis protein